MSFKVVGRSPSSSGLPVMTFHGTIHGDRIELTTHLIDGYVNTGDTELTGKKRNHYRDFLPRQPRSVQSGLDERIYICIVQYDGFTG